MIPRRKELAMIQSLLKRYPVVGLLGARQVGKTTLARNIMDESKIPVTYFDLENPEDLSRLNDPMLALKNLSGLVIIDEVQRNTGLFPVLRVLVDRPLPQTRFLVLGSASPTLLRQGSETLAGRIVFHELQGFSLTEVGITNTDRLWIKGGFPKSYIASSYRASSEWRRGFIKTFLERDIPQLGISIQSTILRRFWTMLAHYHGQIWNSSEFARSFGVADTTVRNYLDILTNAMVVYQIQPWHENIAKRQVKAPKVYLGDSGILHTLLNLVTKSDIESHPKLGSSWEGFVINQIVRQCGTRLDECYFWATHAGAELDLLMVRGRIRFGFEIKRTTSPKLTPSMVIALKDLKLRKLFVIHAGEESYPLHTHVTAIPFTQMFDKEKKLF